MKLHSSYPTLSEQIETPVIIIREGGEMSSFDHNNRFTPRNWLGGESDRYVSSSRNRLPQAPLPFPYRPLFPTGASFPTQIIFLNDEIAHTVNPRLTQFIQEFPPMITTGQQWRMQLPPQEEESNLTEEEQKKALNGLKKKVYNPHPKNKTRKWCLYYRDNSVKEEENDEENKACAICLEDFVPHQEVLITPCKHMFHEDCIVPWVKSHGQCPICRSAIGGERRTENTSPFNNNNNNNNNSNLAAANDLITGDLISLLRAMDFDRLNFPR